MEGTAHCTSPLLITGHEPQQPLWPLSGRCGGGSGGEPGLRARPMAPGTRGGCQDGLALRHGHSSLLRTALWGGSGSPPALS